MVGTAPIRRATQQYQQYFPQATAAEAAGVGQATGTLTAAQQQAVDAQRAAAAQARGDITTGMTQGIGYLQGGEQQARGDLSKALGLYSPLAGTANQAFNMYGQALGLGGPQGNAAAVNAFQTDPGYQFQMQQGQEALMRDANRRGMLSSGNLTEDELRFSQGLADQGYQQWLQNLWGLGGQAPGLAGAQAGLYGGLADLATGFGQAAAGVTGAGYGGLANLASQMGSNLSNIYTGTGRGIAGLQAGLGQDTAQNILGQGQVGYQGAQDIFNARAQEAANDQSMWANLLGAGAGLAGRVLGGPIGGQIGTAAGGYLGGMIG